MALADERGVLLCEQDQHSEVGHQPRRCQMHWVSKILMGSIALAVIAALLCLLPCAQHGSVMHESMTAISDGSDGEGSVLVLTGLDDVDGTDVAIAIGSAGEGSGGKAKSKDAYSDFGLLSTRKDLEDFKAWCAREDWYMAGTLNAEGILGSAQGFLKEVGHACTDASNKRLMIYYSGHGEEGTGDWCFPGGGRIKLADIMRVCTPLPKYGLMIRSDACFSGQWAYEAERHRYDIIVETSSGAYRTALDRIFAKGFFQGNDEYKDKVSMRGALQYQNGKVRYLDKAGDFSLAVANAYHTHHDAEITATAFSSSSGVVVVSKMPWGRQSWTMAAWGSARKFIDRKWKEDYHITSIRYTHFNHWWSVVMTKDSGIYWDKWHIRTSIEGLHKAVREAWEKGHSIIDISYGEGKWLLLEGDHTELKDCCQSWRWCKSWKDARQFIKDQWDKGNYITTMTRGGDEGTWIVVTSPMKEVAAQSWLFHSADTIHAEIKKKYADGFEVTQIWDNYDFSKDIRYLVIMTKFRAGSQTSKFFPHKDVWQSITTGLQVS